MVADKMKVYLCQKEIQNWRCMGILDGIMVLPSFTICACQHCDNCEHLPVSIPRADVHLFCNAIDGVFGALDDINFNYQSELIEACKIATDTIATFYHWSATVAFSSSSATTILSAFLFNGRVRPISKELALEVLNQCDTFSLKDRVRFCVAHHYLPTNTDHLLKNESTTCWDGVWQYLFHTKRST